MLYRTDSSQYVLELRESTNALPLTTEERYTHTAFVATTQNELVDHL